MIEVAGVSRETFDEMFDDKEACFLEAYDAVIDVLVAHVTSAFEAAGGRALAGADRRRRCGPWSSCSPPRPTSPGWRWSR